MKKIKFKGQKLTSKSLQIKKKDFRAVSIPYNKILCEGHATIDTGLFFNLTGLTAMCMENTLSTRWPRRMTGRSYVPGPRRFTR